MELFALYLGSLIVGGGLVGVSLFADHDHDADFDADADFDVDVAADHDVDHDIDSVGAADAMWLPFLSVRFWLFFVAFFGLTGTLLDGLALSGWQVTLGTAIGVGFTCGYIASRLVQVLRRENVSSAVDPDRDYAGRQGLVLLEVAEAEGGQVRVEVKGQSIDLPAQTVDGSTLARGEKVIVLEFAENKLKVAKFDTGEHARLKA